MQGENCVIFKGRKDGIAILLDDETEFSQIKETLRQKARDAKGFFAGAKAGISFMGRDLTDDEQDALLAIVSEESGLSLSFVRDADFVQELPRIPAVARDTGNTIFHHGSLRSGQAVEFAGSVVIIGDVNPGAEIIAEGNIIVLGALKGMAHAGCAGDQSCFVCALVLSPTQLRIAEIITYIPEDRMSSWRRKRKEKPVPSSAYIHNGQIYIAPLQ